MIEQDTYALSNEINLVGRAMICDVRLQDISVSLKHAKIVCENDRYYIQDLKSTNKTYLKNGMKVRFGDVECEFKE